MHRIDHTAHLWMHEFVRAIARMLGYDYDAMPAGLHYILHIVIFWGPLFLLAFMAWAAWRWLRRRHGLQQRQEPAPSPYPGLPAGIFQFILAYSRAQQILVVVAGLAAMPILYVALELPKRIINGALAEDHQPATLLGVSVDQTTHLLVLCSLYLLAVLLNGAVKFWINVYKGKVGERLLRRPTSHHLPIVATRKGFCVQIRGGSHHPSGSRAGWWLRVRQLCPTGVSGRHLHHDPGLHVHPGSHPGGRSHHASPGSAGAHSAPATQAEPPFRASVSLKCAFLAENLVRRQRGPTAAKAFTGSDPV